jgi:hypothetical protein
MTQGGSKKEYQMNTATESKMYPWSGWDLSDPTKVFATCADCDWKHEVKTAKTPVAFYAHYEAVHEVEAKA